MPAIGRRAAWSCAQGPVIAECLLGRVVGVNASLAASFMRHGVQHDTATHPGTHKRVAHLRVLAQQ